jgi:hypothetical protein
MLRGDVSEESRTPRGVSVHIGELELSGFPVERRHAIADACVRELQRLLTADPLVDVTARARISGSTVGAPIDPHAAPGIVGISIAQAVVDTLRSRR